MESCWLKCMVLRCVLAGKGSYFAAIAANSHRTPAPGMRARIVVEVQTTSRIGANPKTCAGTLCDNLRAGPGDCGEQPVQSAFSRDEFDSVAAVLSNQFVVPFGDAQDGVYRLDPFAVEFLLSEHPREQPTQGGAEVLGFQEERFCCLLVRFRQAQ